MSFNPAPNHERCTGTREYIGPFPVTTTKHHPTCTNPDADKEMRTR